MRGILLLLEGVARHARLYSEDSLVRILIVRSLPAIGLALAHFSSDRTRGEYLENWVPRMVWVSSTQEHYFQYELLLLPFITQERLTVIRLHANIIMHN